MNLRGPHGLEIRIMRFPLTEEAFYIGVRRGAALILLREKWLLHPANAVQRLTSKDKPGAWREIAEIRDRKIIELPTPRGIGRFRESD